MPHDGSGLVPYLITNLTLIEYVFHGFFLLVAEMAYGGPNKASLPYVVSGEEPILYQEPEKGRNLWPEFGLPNYVPNVIFFMCVKVLLNLIGLLDRESTRCGVSPTKDVLVCADTNFPIIHCF